LKIRDVHGVAVRVPLERPYVISRGVMHAFESVIVRIDTDNGVSGFGESVALSVVGEVAPIVQRIRGPVTEILAGRDPFEIEALNGELLAALQGDLDTLSGVDVALWDLMGKALGVPVHRLMGGVCNNPILVDYTIGALAPAEMAAVASEMCAERVRAVRQAVPAGATVRVDCNGGYTVEQALRFLGEVAPLGLEFVEQPVARDDLAGMRRCRESGVAVSADESLDSLADALALVSERACDVFNVKIPKVGGLTRARKIAAVAEAAGLPVVVGGRTTLELSRYASRHFAAATALTRGRAHEGPGPASQAVSDDVVVTRTSRAWVRRGNGHVPVETGPGLGADVSWDKVQHYAIRL